MIKISRTIFALFLLFALGGGHQAATSHAVSSSHALEPDALVISGLTVDPITPFSAVITWTTNNSSDSRVEFGPTVAYGRLVSSSSPTLTHKIVLSSLAGNTLYHFRVTSQTGSETATSEDRTFTTPSSRIMLRNDGAFLVDGQPFFPLVQWLQCAHRISYQKTLGLNTFMGQGCDETAQDYLNTAAAQGVWGIVKFDASAKNHAALLGWYWEDEPDMPRTGTEPLLYPNDVLGIYENIKAQDSNHPFWLTLTARFASRFEPYPWMGIDKEEYIDYANAADVPGFDHYPIYGWCQPTWIHDVGDFQNELLTLYAPGKPTFQWIEAVKTSSQWCDLPERGQDDGPYDYEIRNEVWQAIVHGAKAIGYFTHSWECPGYTQFCLSDPQIAELTRTNGQITRLTSAILGDEYTEAVSEQTPNGGRVDFMVKQQADDIYIFAVNMERATETVTFTLNSLASNANVAVVDENRSIQLHNKSFSDAFAPLGVHIYRIPASQSELELEGFPADQAIHLSWDVNISLPVTSTWRIDYYTQTANIYTTTIPVSITRSTTLVDHVQNYQWYTITLNAMLDQTAWLSDTVRVMPTDISVHLPLVRR